jgi:hypothetical protein
MKMNADPKLLPILKQAVEGTLRLLPTSLQGQILAPWLENPAEVPEWKSYKGIGSDQYRAILFPAKRPYKPRNFWSAEHCMYEIAIGSIGGIWGIKVQMLFGGHREICGKDAYYVGPVSDILLIASKRRTEFRFKPNPDRGNISLVRVLPGFDPEEAAKDMAWIIAETFPRIIALPDAPK